MVIDFSTFYNFPNQIEKIFEDFSRPLYFNLKGGTYPPLHLSENDEAITIRAEIPGVEMEDIELTLNNKSLVIRGERKVEKGKYYRQERPTGAFQRIVNLNVPVDREAIKATMSNGLLTVVLPKAEEVRPTKINIDVT